MNTEHSESSTYFTSASQQVKWGYYFDFSVFLIFRHFSCLFWFFSKITQKKARGRKSVLFMPREHFGMVAHLNGNMEQIVARVIIWKTTLQLQCTPYVCVWTAMANRPQLCPQISLMSLPAKTTRNPDCSSVSDLLSAYWGISGLLPSDLLINVFLTT